MRSSAGYLHGGIRRVVIFVVLLLAVSAVPVLAVEPEAPQVVVPQSPDPIDPSLLPTAEDVTAAIEQGEDEEAARQEWLSSSEARQERDASRLTYADISAEEAEALFGTAFADQLAMLNADPARFLSDAQLVAIGDEPTDATVKDDGNAMVLDAGIPIRTESDGGNLQKVDLSLEDTGQGFETTNALVDVIIPDTAGELTKVGDDGLAISQQGLLPDKEARTFGDANVFYPNVLTDTDLIISPIAGGVEVFNQLRSQNSPETFRFEVFVPSGAELKPATGDGVEVVAGDEVLAFMPPPIALDAQGSDVPVDMAVEGNSVVLHIAHRAGDYAMPILLDPILENNENWIYGQNHNALDMGVWELQKNVAGIYGSTYCIYHCFGQPSNVRGLFVSGQSGTYWPNQFAHWVYGAPNANTFITSTTLSPYVRYDHGCNAATTSYKQPHDYFGIWGANEAWNYVSVNSANQPGNTYTLPQDGRAAIFGLGTGGSPVFSIPCWRDLYAAGAHVWLDDWSQPQLSTTSTAQWMDTVSARLNVSASDVGLGIGWFNASATDTSGNTQTWKTSHGCTGTRRSPCPGVWNLASSDQPKLNYNPAVIPNGIRDLAVTAYDPASHQSTETRIMTIRVDHAKPTIALSGTLTEQAKLGTELGKYTLKVVAKDGNKAGSDPEQQAGVSQLVLKMDGQQFDVEPDTAGCPSQSCSVTLEHDLITKNLSVGTHTVEAIAKDALVHEENAKLTFSITRDKIPPTLSLSGKLAGTEPVGKEAGLTFYATDNRSGVVQVKVEIDGSLRKNYTQSCPQEKCSLANTTIESLAALGSGSHMISVTAIDAEGNVRKESRTFYVDISGPEVTLSGPLAEAEGNELSQPFYGLAVAAADKGLATGVAGSGVVGMRLEIDSTVVKSWSASCGSTSCPPTLNGEHAFQTAVWPGQHVAYLTATDRLGNSTVEALPIGYPTELPEAADCASGEVHGAVSTQIDAEDAAALVEDKAGELVEPSDPATAGEVELAPSLVPTSPNLSVTGTFPGGEVARSIEDGAVVGPTQCLAPVITSDDATEALIIGGDAAIYANTAEDADTVIRPTALGVTVAQQLRSPDAPDTYEWDLDLAEDQDLVKLPSGAVAVVQPESGSLGAGDEKVEGSADVEGYGETAPPQPDPIEDASKTGENLAYEKWQLASAQEEVSDGVEVVAMIPSPWVRTAGGMDIPAFLTVAEDRVILHIEDLPGPEEEPEGEGEEGPIVSGDFPVFTGFRLIASPSSLPGCSAQAHKPYVRQAVTWYGYQYKAILWGASMRCTEVQWMKVTVSGQQEKSFFLVHFWDAFVSHSRDENRDGPIGILDGGECKSSNGDYNNFRAKIDGIATNNVRIICTASTAGYCTFSASDDSKVARYRCVGGSL